MTATVEAFDADGHVLEPLWKWADYVAPSFRDDALRVHRDAEDGDKLIVQGRPSRLVRRLGGVIPDGDGFLDWNSLALEGGYASYKDSCPTASWDPVARLSWLDAHGLTATFLFPSLHLIWPRELDPLTPWAVAHFDAFNRFLAEFMSTNPTRLFGVAMLSMTHERSIADWIDALCDDGFKHVMLPFGLRMGTLRAEGFWAAAADHDVVVHLHKVAIPHQLEMPVPTAMSAPGASPFFRHVIEILPGQLFLTSLIGDGVLDRFPTLRFAFHECNAGWVPAWVERARESYDVLVTAGSPVPEHEPGVYVFERHNISFSVGTGEALNQFPNELLARIMMATDFPHPGCVMDPQYEWSKALEGIGDAAGRGVLHDNGIRLVRGRTPCK